MSTICIILRNIDAEAAAEFDLLIFCYLKVIHIPFPEPDPTLHEPIMLTVHQDRKPNVEEALLHSG